jgi:hypothetical protein
MKILYPRGGWFFIININPNHHSKMRMLMLIYIYIYMYSLQVYEDLCEEQSSPGSLPHIVLELTIRFLPVPLPSNLLAQHADAAEHYTIYSGVKE